MSITFTKKVPDELYVDSFDKELEATYSYDGPETFKVLVEKTSGLVSNIIEDNDDFRYNQEHYAIVDVDSSLNPDVADYIFNTATPERIFEDEILADGSIYKKITNPTLRDYFSIQYNFEENSWVWKVIVRNPSTIMRDLAIRNREFVSLNLSLIEDDKVLTNLANDYIKRLDNYIISGRGSIPMWKLDEFKLSDVPMIPQELIVAFNQLP